MNEKKIIESGKAILGIEFGSTRIKAVLIDPENRPISQGSFEWENKLVDDCGLIVLMLYGMVYGNAMTDLRKNVKQTYDTEIETWQLSASVP